MTSSSTLNPDAGSAGRRERKKAETRAKIADAALELFLDRGYNDVTIREVAEHADVALATVFAHFSGKEALVFDENDAIFASLIAAVRSRSADVDPIDAIQAWFVNSRASRAAGHLGDADYTQFRALVTQTPVLHAYWQTTWRRHRPELSHALSESSALEADAAEVAATFIIEGYLLAIDRTDFDSVISLALDAVRKGLLPPAA
ncbi:TetR/AcrR family transcriptional regulator [Paenarthrobacter nicotinovorans]|uniref:TetR/AcrR family transcriptional regulator n=1 Tax=Paenarthrobacter nicotinovorans TaxID=29320 RepID=UPI003D677F8F